MLGPQYQLYSELQCVISRFHTVLRKSYIISVTILGNVVIGL